MQTTASASSLPHDSFNYSPDDLEFMRRAFRRACEENPYVTNTPEQRNALAQAIVHRYQPELSEAELIAVAMRQGH